MHANSLTSKVLDFVKENPGVVRDDIFRGIPQDGVLISTISTILQRLQTQGAVENRGGSGHAARWYPIESKSDPQYYAVAVELLDELKEVHHSRRDEHLAIRLEEIFDK